MTTIKENPVHSIKDRGPEQALRSVCLPTPSYANTWIAQFIGER